MGSQPISNAVRSFFLAIVLAGLLTGSAAQAASYEKTDGTIVDPIQYNCPSWGGSDVHSYSGPNLEPGADMDSANLIRADLYLASLNSTNLTGADLRDASLRYASLREATLSDATLYDADLEYADLTEADLSGAHLSFADLEDAHLDGTNLYYADLSFANLHGAELNNADLTGAKLKRAEMSNADLIGAEMSATEMNEADTSGANMSGANLYNANMSAAWMSNANLWGANLSFASFYATDLSGAIFSYAQNWDTANWSGSFYYIHNMPTWASGMDPTALGTLALALYCDFTPDAVCELEYINQTFQAGNLVTGVATSGDTDRLELVDNDTIDAADITEWLAQAATANGDGSPYLRGDTDITDFNLLATNFAPAGYGTSALPEPSTMLLASLALVLVGVSFRLSKNV